MKTSTRLRIAAALATVQGVAHGALLLLAKPRHGAAELAVIDAMKSHRFDFSGATRSYWDFYLGYGIEAAAVCLIEAVLLIQLSRIADARAELVRPLLLLIALANLAHIILIARYFFYLPAIFDLLIAACVVWAYASSEPAQSLAPQ